MQFYPLHRRYVSSDIRVARLGSFHGKVAVLNVKEIAQDSTCARVYRHGRYFRVVDLWILCRRRRNRLETCLKKQRNVDKKTLRVLVLYS